jgi:hypothetical protein
VTVATLETVTLPIPPEWRAAARYIGHKHVAAWVRCVVEDFLETGPGRFFPLLPLVWHRRTFQAIRTADCTTYAPHEVRGLVSGPFGIYAGCYFIRTDPRREEGFTLAHVPTGRKLATLDLAGACKRLAEELAPLRMGWHHTDPERVTGPDSAKVNAIVARHERDAVPIRSDAHAGVGGRR